MGKHADSSIPGRLAVVHQIIPTGCRQHTAFVVSCSHIGSKGELSEELLNPSQSVCFLGTQLNSRAMRATLTVGSRQVLQGTLARFQVH